MGVYRDGDTGLYKEFRDVNEEDKTFVDYGVREDIAAALAAKGITQPFPIQALTLPVALEGHDIIGQAKTGTGKTLGFGLPAIQRVVGREDAGWDSLKIPGAPQALIIVPTRELAVQVGSDLSAAAAQRNARIETLYGGSPYDAQVKALEKGVEIVVGTPGRLIDLHRQKYLNLSQVKMVVLDEADEMLDLGFLPDVERLLAALPEARQSMLFSATMPGPVLTMARRYMTKPMHIRAEAPGDDSKTKASIRQVIYRAHPLDKDEMVGRILRAEGRGRTIIFTRTKRSAAKLSEELISRGFAAAALHGDLNQGAREKALQAFRDSKIDILVATDVAARGIDVDDVTHVINYQMPEDEKAYTHRTGRTGRASNEGTAVTFVDWEDVPRWKFINQALELNVPEPVETYSSSPHLFTDLGIPAGSKGRLPKDEQTLEGIGSQRQDIDSRDSRGGGRGEGRGRGGNRRQRSDDRRSEGTRSANKRSEGKVSSEDAGEKHSECPTRRRTRAEGTEQRSKTVEKREDGTRRRRRRRNPSAETE
ncbi:DEAD/DEAH box helicase [Rothia sp. ZJ932]|nr:DEAD/DEAH box helicase [Rothia sp. ZJ932]